MRDRESILTDYRADHSGYGTMSTTEDRLAAVLEVLLDIRELLLGRPLVYECGHGYDGATCGLCLRDRGR